MRIIAYDYRNYFVGYKKKKEKKKKNENYTTTNFYERRIYPHSRDEEMETIYTVIIIVNV